MELTTVWFCLIAVLWIGYFVLEGFDFGVGMLLPVLGTKRHRAPRPDQHHRSGVGRQRGVAAGRGRCDVRCLPRVVRDALQRVLPAAADHPARAHRARRRVRVPAQARRRELAPHAGTPRSSSARSCPRCCGESRSPTSCGASTDQRRQGVRRQLLRPAEPLRVARWSHHAHAVPHPRRDVRRAQDRRRHPAPSPRPQRPGRCWSPPSWRWSFLVWTQAEHGSPGSSVLFAGRGACSRRGAGRSLGRSRGLGLRRHVRRIARRRGGALHRALPRRDALDARPGVQPDHDERVGDRLHADDHDPGRGRLHAARAALPGLDLLGLPQADRHPPHPADQEPAASRTPLRCRSVDPRVLEHLRPARRPRPGARRRRRRSCWSSSRRSRVGPVVAVVRPEPIGGWAHGCRRRAAGARWRRSWRLRRRTPRAPSAERCGLASWAPCSGWPRTSRGPGPTGELPLWATRGTAAAEPYLSGYLPSLVLAVPPPVAWWPRSSRRLFSGLIVLVHAAADAGVRRPDRARHPRRVPPASGGSCPHSPGTSSTSSGGCPTLVVLPAARRAGPAIRAVTDRYRRASLETLRLASRPRAALELWRRCRWRWSPSRSAPAGRRLTGFRAAMFVLLLAPEAYWPLRRVGRRVPCCRRGDGGVRAGRRDLRLPPTLHRLCREIHAAASARHPPRRT